MVCQVAGSRVTLANQRRMEVHFGGKTYHLDLEQSTAFARRLLRRKRYLAAAKVCEAAMKLSARSRQAAILLAQCQAGLKNYAACNELLREALGCDAYSVAKQLHAAFVYLNLGLPVEAMRELTSVVRDHPELPCVCLILADLFAMAGDRRNASRCYRLAIRRDPHGGPIGQAARRELARGCRRRADRTREDRRGSAGDRDLGFRAE
jgi:tetratricopeptide (TPR) repeat protein